MVRKVAFFLLVVYVLSSTAYQITDVYLFVNRGARFTLRDGQTLCARVLRLEAMSGSAVAGCEFTESGGGNR